MTKARKQSLMLVVALALILFLVASIISATSNVSTAIAEDSSTVAGSGSGSGSIAASGDEGAIVIGDLMINGNVPDNYSVSGTPISTVAELQSFLKGEKGTYGYLTTDIASFSWSGSFTNILMAEGRTLDGCGHKIYMTATTLNTQPWQQISANADYKNALKNTFTQDLSYDGSGFPEDFFDLNGGLVGYIPSNSTIKNINFVYNGQVAGSYNSAESGAGAIIAAVSSGTIDNCSLTVNGYLDIATKGTEADFWGGYKEMARHSYTIGGYVGLLSNNGVVSNSKITLNGTTHTNSNVGTAANISASRGANRTANVRVWGGGVAGWMGNGASVYNITTAGSGNIAAVTGYSGSNAGDNPLSYSGIVAGSCAIPSKNTGDQSSVVGDILSAGSIDGVINTWTGRAVYLVGSNSTHYSPIGQVSNSIASQICGLSGNQKNSGATVSNVYFMYDESEIENSSVTGYNFATGNCGMSVERIYIMDYDEASGQYYNVNGTAKAANAYLTFSSNLKTADVLAVYNTDLQNNPGAILWQMEVNLDTANNPSGEITNFYDKITEYEEAGKYEVTYTTIERTHSSPTEIKYQLGKIVYYKFRFSDNVTATPEGKNYRLSDKEYDGSRVIIPNIDVYDYATNSVCKTIDYNSPEAGQYWVAKKTDDMNIYSLDDTKNVGEYEYFIYNNQPESAIDVLDTTNRYVAYRKDNDAYPTDGSGATSGATTWQPRVYQNVVAKNLSVTLNAPADFAANNQYDGEAVLYTAAFGSGIVAGDTVNATLKYYNSDGSLPDNNSAINAGDYYVMLESLSNSNYTYDYEATRVDFTIAKREVSILNNTLTPLESDYYLSVQYNGLDRSLTYGIYNDKPALPVENIVICNVLDKDHGIINVAHNGDTVNVGSFEVNIGLNEGIAARNYNLAANVTYTVYIDKADVVLNLTETEKSIAFGQINSAPAITVTGVNNEVPTGEWYYIDYDLKDTPFSVTEYTQGVPSIAGKYAVVYYVGGSFGVNKNYNEAVSAACTYNVTPRKVTVTFDDGLPTNYEYNGSAVPVAATYETQNNETNTGLLNIHAGRVKLEYSFVKNGSDTVSEAIDAGSYTVTAKLVASFDISSYEIVYEDGGFAFEIAPKQVGVNIADAQKVYGELDPEFVWSYADAEKTFIERDGVVLNLSTAAGQFGGVGEYDITCTSTEGNVSNYDIVYDNGTMTVVPYEVSVVTTTSKTTMVYGDEAPVFGFEYVGDNRFYEGDGIVITAVADKEVKNVGTYEVIVTGYNDNYIVNMEKATFEITPKDIRILSAEIVGEDSFVYTGEVIAPEVRAVFEDGALVGDDTVSVAFDYFQNGEKVNAINVGTYDAVISGVDSPNYNLVIGEGQELPSTTFTITQREVSITVNNATREYGIADITPVGDPYTYNTGVTFVQSDIDSGKLVVEFVTDVDITAGAQDYPDSLTIVISGEAADNYILTVTQKGTLTVTGTSISSIQLVSDQTSYTGENLIGQIAFNVAEGITGYTYKITSDAEGLNVITEIINTGTYYVTVSVDGSGSMFTGEPNTLTFVVNKAERVLSADDIEKIINYNKLTFNSAFENMQYKVDDGAYLTTNTFDAKALTSYTVSAKAGETDNYLESNEVTFTVTTGINPSTVIAAIDSIDKVDFSNIDEYKSMLSQLELVGEDDMASIDTEKVDALRQSYEDLLSGAIDVIGGAQSVATKASGMTGKGALTLALTTGAGLALAGVMLSVSAKKREKDDKKKMPKANKKNLFKVIVATVAIATVFAVVFAACETKTFTQDSLFQLASYSKASNEKDREVVIEVKSGSTLIYKYDDGEETFADGLNPDGSFSLSGKGTGFNFKNEYFENASFTDSNGTATFKADIKDAKNFLGIASATKGKVTVTADSANSKLKTISVSYDVESNGTTYSVSVNVTMKY